MGLACSTSFRVAPSSSSSSTAKQQCRQQSEQMLRGACSKDDLQVCHQLLLQSGLDLAQIEGSDNNKQPILHDAVMYGRIEVAAFLLEHGAAVDKPNKCGETALLKACYMGQTEIGRMLLDKANARTDIQDHDGQTALHYAAIFNRTELANAMLLQQQPPPPHELINARDGKGNTPLLLAIRWGQTETARVLLEHGCDIQLANCSGDTPLALGRASRCPRMVALMRQWQAAHAVWALLLPPAAQRGKNRLLLPFELIYMVAQMLM